MARKSDRRIDRKVRLALDSRPKATDSGALLACLMEKWGGPEQLASDMYEEFQQAPMGGMVRKHILELLQRLIMDTTRNEIGQVKKPAEMEDSELDDLVMHYLGRLTSATNSTKSEEKKI